MAEWGIAMSRWGNPFTLAQRAAGPLKEGAGGRRARPRPSGRRRRASRPTSTRSRTLFTDADTVDQRTRIVAYGDAMAAVAAAYPADLEAQVFYALAIAGSRAPTDKTYANQLKAGAILEGLFGSSPITRASRTTSSTATTCRPLATARGRRAPLRGHRASAPHALHMPSHTFTRVGSWQESIDTNIASDDARQDERHAAKRCTRWTTWPTRTCRPARTLRRTALLPSCPRSRRASTGRLGGAAPGSAGVFALAAIPARYALERGDWAAAALDAAAEPHPLPRGDDLVRPALGAARTGDAADAKAASSSSSRIRDELTAKKEAYWAEQVEIQRRIGDAWLRSAKAGTRGARRVAAAADLEDTTEKSAVTPGPLAPARELFGEMLLRWEAARGARGVRGDPEKGAESLPRAVRCDPGGNAGRPDRQGTPARPDAAEDVCQGRRAGTAGACRSEEARLVRAAVALDWRVGAGGAHPTRTVSAGSSFAPAATSAENKERSVGGGRRQARRTRERQGSGVRGSSSPVR